MANELTRLADRYQWKPIAEIHEDFGECILMNIEDPGNMALGNNLSLGYDESLWTHFTQITPLGQEEADRMKSQTLAQETL